MNLPANLERLSSQWMELVRLYLPVKSSNSIWCYSRTELPSDPAQGWKLHIAATLLSAVPLFQRVAPVLKLGQILFKAPVSLDELDRLNSGIYYGYSQVGKFLTIYPQTTCEAVQLARELHRVTRHIACPEVPFDLQYRETSCVYYRYGGFKATEVKPGKVADIDMLRRPDGKLIPDNRERKAIPEWLDDPFQPSRRVTKTLKQVTPLQTTFKAFRAFTQRGRGGVYQALDLSVRPPRLCVIKQGRQHGEVSWDGRDGRWRVKHEAEVLKTLRREGIAVPCIHSSFKSKKNFYLVIEFIEGECLDRWLTRRKRRLSIGTALKRSAEVARLVARIHASGWVWRDCKPGNLIVSTNGELRPLDFEGACRINQSDPIPWGTPGYTSPEVDNPFNGQPRHPEDLYALGAVIYLLFAGRIPEPKPVPLQKMRKNVPEPIRKVVNQLLDTNPRRRPRAHTVVSRLDATLKILNCF